MRRGPYAGAVGYVGWGARTLDTAIAIRTCVMKGGRAWIQAGAGIVADSDPAAEWRETEAKARAVLLALALAEKAGKTETVGEAEAGDGRQDLEHSALPDVPDPSRIFTTCPTASSASPATRLRAPRGRSLVVGRGSSSDIAIYDPTISRRHAELTWGPDGVQVKDLGSSNGTCINGSRVSSGRLQPNDSITFGKVALPAGGAEASGGQPVRSGASAAPPAQPGSGRPHRPPARW